MATQQERDLFLRGWRAAMEEVLVVLQSEARAWAEEEREASQSGEYKLPGSFALSEVRGSFKGRHELLAWITSRTMRVKPAKEVVSVSNAELSITLTLQVLNTNQ